MKMPTRKTFIKYGLALTAAGMTSAGTYLYYSDKNMNEQWQENAATYRKYEKLPPDSNWTNHYQNELISNTNPPGTTGEQDLIIGLAGVAAAGVVFLGLSKLKL
jgi:hypothetical protein